MYSDQRLPRREGRSMLQAHQRLGDFEIIRLLGKGGMGEVYEAEQFAPRRRVALKVLAPWLAQDEDALRRFWREAEVPAQLDHPNIVRIISTGRTDDGIAFYTMQLVRGISVADLIRRARHTPAPTVAYPNASAETPSLEAPLPDAGAGLVAVPAFEETPPLGREYRRNHYRTLARVGAAVARALAFAHRQGFVHRDLKPSNIMADHHDQVYVVDFGLTRALEADGTGTQAGILTGTPLYMSPEQAEGKSVDARSGIYSLGVTLYEMATKGVAPYTANPRQKEALLTQIRTGQCLPLRMLAPDVPPKLERIISRAMKFRAKDRYADAAEMAADLERYLDSKASATVQPRRAARVWSKRVARISGAGAALLLVVALVAGWPWIASLFPTDDPTAPPIAGGAADDTQPAVRGQPLPPMLVDRPWRLPINLFSQHPVEPVWSAQLMGEGTLFRFPEHLHLAAKKNGGRFLLALDNDPKKRSFEFSVEMKPVLSDQPGHNELGVFFGWQLPPAADPGRLCPYLAVNLDKKKGWFQIVGNYAIKAQQVGQGSVGGTIALSGEKSKLPLSLPGPWHALRIRVLGNRITIRADAGHPTEFDGEQLKQINPVFAYLNPRGALGIWTNGDAMFRNAQIIALPEEKAGE